MYDMVFLQHDYQTAVQTMNFKFVLYYNIYKHARVKHQCTYNT